MKIYRAISAFLFITFLAGCTPAPVTQPAITQDPTRTATLLPPTPTGTATPLPTPTELRPLTLVFYGDSTLKIGEVGKQGQVGFSYVDNLRMLLDPSYNLITANYGGKSARWAYENLEQSVLSLDPNVVTLEWGWDDLHGCLGIFDRNTNSLLDYKLVALIKDHIKYLKLQIDALLAHGIAVFVVTPVLIYGGLPWSYYGPNNEIITESDRWCNYNLGVEKLVEAQKQLVVEYTTDQKPVYLVDAWQIFKDHPNEEKMYIDIPHPASRGAELIAEGWMQAFTASKIR
jgi:hypothetical protein